MAISRLQQAQVAVRPALKARMLLAGPPGAGKSRTGLIIATELAEGKPILAIDSENGSLLTYADDFAFTHLPWKPPFDPRDLAATIDEAGAQFAVVLVDSLSHWWRGEGGTLDIAGGRFGGWKEARPAQDELVQSILGCGAHIILTVRSKVEYAQETEGGKQVVKKLGMATVQDDTLEYEVNVAVELGIDHSAAISKSRTTVLPVGRVYRAGHAAEMAETYREWLAGGEPPVVRDQAEQILAVLNAIPETAEDHARTVAKKAFMAQYGRPEQVVASNFVNALAFAKSLAGETPPEVPEPASAESVDPTPPGSDPPAEPVSATVPSPELVNCGACGGKGQLDGEDCPHCTGGLVEKELVSA
jgi:DNA polymerase III delta prime subunit